MKGCIKKGAAHNPAEATFQRPQVLKALRECGWVDIVILFGRRTLQGPPDAWRFFMLFILHQKRSYIIHESINIAI